MQNAPAMLAQKMMNRQAPYGPIGMVSQNMSGNKKGAAGVIGLKFDTATATSGTTFSNSNTTATLPTSTIGSAKGNSVTTTGGTSAWYWEFTIGSISVTLVGFGISTFVCNTTNRVGVINNTVAYSTGNGNILGGFGGNIILATGITSTLGDIIGFKLDLTPSSSTLTVLKNNVVIGSAVNTTTYIPSSATAWVPIVSSAAASVCSATISNNIYSAPGYTPIGPV